MSEQGVKVEGTDQPGEQMVSAHRIRRATRNLFPELPGQDQGEGLLATLMKAERFEKEGPSNKGTRTGRRTKPFNFRAVIKFKTHNIHHSTCIEAKKSATVGLGHVETKASDVLDPLTAVSWLYLLLKVAEDYFSAGNGWLEVVRRGTGKGEEEKITGLHHAPMCDVEINVEDQAGNFHYEVRGDGGTVEKKFAAFGDKKDFMRRRSLKKKPSEVSELIHFPEASSLSRWYGFPSWMAAVSSIELVQAMVQHQFDFHLNRGVPEFMLFILGAKVGNDNWAKITDALDATVGLGNAHKTFAVNLEDPDIEVQLEKLAMEGVQDGAFFKDMMETLAVGIVSAHRVPPSLAGILIPGKVGAANETSNAIMAFQSLVVGQAQRMFETILGCTLGNEKINGDLGLTREDFTFNTIVDEIAEQMEKLKPMDTVGRMRDELGDAAAEGRDIDDGLQKIAKRVGEMLLAQYKDSQE